MIARIVLDVNSVQDIQRLLLLLHSSSANSSFVIRQSVRSGTTPYSLPFAQFTDLSRSSPIILAIGGRLAILDAGLVRCPSPSPAPNWKPASLARRRADWEAFPPHGLGGKVGPRVSLDVPLHSHDTACRSPCTLQNVGFLGMNCMSDLSGREQFSLRYSRPSVLNVQWWPLLKKQTKQIIRKKTISRVPTQRKNCKGILILLRSMGCP